MADNGGGPHAVRRDVDAEWVAWDGLPRHIRLFMAEQPYEFSSADALDMWNQINSDPWTDPDATYQFKWQIEQNVRALLRESKEEKASGRYFKTYYSQAT
jgi:hypothetical protein